MHQQYQNNMIPISVLALCCLICSRISCRALPLALARSATKMYKIKGIHLLNFASSLIEIEGTELSTAENIVDAFARSAMVGAIGTGSWRMLVKLFCTTTGQCSDAVCPSNSTAPVMGSRPSWRSLYSSYVSWIQVLSWACLPSDA